MAAILHYNSPTDMRPEHQHYDTIEQWFRKSISEGHDFLFDSQLFDNEMRRMWEAYDVPYEVSFRPVV